MARWTRAGLTKWAAANDVELLLYDPPEVFDAAIIGVGRRFTSYFVVYDYDAVIRALIRDSNGCVQDAYEHFEHNVVGGWIGEGTPAFVQVGSDDGPR